MAEIAKAAYKQVFNVDADEFSALPVAGESACSKCAVGEIHPVQECGCPVAEPKQED